MKAWLILLSKEILFLSHMCIHNHLDRIKWCKMEKDMPLVIKHQIYDKWSACQLCPNWMDAKIELLFIQKCSSNIKGHDQKFEKS
jgi:hypothetical protein